MTETKTENRTLDEIKKEYGDLIFKAGNLQYQIVTLQKDLDITNSLIRDINFEAAAVIAQTKEESNE